MALAPVKYNIPEIIAKDHENQVLVVLKNSSRLFALQSFLKYGKTVSGSKQPNLDDFSTLVSLDLLKKQKAELIFLHLTDTDTQKHHYGINSPEALASVKRMDERIGKLVEAAASNYQILIVSDHAQVDAHYFCDLNKINPIENTWWHISDGSAFLLNKGPLTLAPVDQVKNWLEQQSFFKRYLSLKEMESSGFAQVSALGITAAKDWSFSIYQHLGNHGYPLDIPDYQPFYFVKGLKVKENQVLSGGSVLDICPLILRLLDLTTFKQQGQLKEEIFN